jgi:hypothetical protein
VIVVGVCCNLQWTKTTASEKKDIVWSVLRGFFEFSLVFIAFFELKIEINFFHFLRFEIF